MALSLPVVPLPEHDQDDQIADLYCELLLFRNDAFVDVCNSSSASVKRECLDILSGHFESYIVNMPHMQVLCADIMHFCQKLASTCRAQVLAVFSSMHSLRAFGHPYGYCFTSPPYCCCYRAQRCHPSATRPRSAAATENSAGCQRGVHQYRLEKVQNVQDSQR